MSEEVYFLHCCFSEPIEIVWDIIESHGYGSQNTMIDNKGLKPIEKSGTKVVWQYLPRSSQNTDEKEMLFSNIELVHFSDDYHSPTEVKITCSDDVYLLDYFEDIGKSFRENLSICNKELTLPKPNVEPYFKFLFHDVFQQGQEKKIHDGFSEDELIPGELDTGKQKKKSKRGRSWYTDEQKLEALKKWDDMDPAITTISLEEFLENEFGSEAGILNVATSTFHGWRSQLRKKGIYKNS